MNTYYEINNGPRDIATALRDSLAKDLTAGQLSAWQYCYTLETMAFSADENCWTTIKDKTLSLLVDSNPRVKQAAAVPVQSAAVKLRNNGGLTDSEWDLLVWRGKGFAKSQDEKLRIVALNLLEALVAAGRGTAAESLLRTSEKYHFLEEDQDTPEGFRPKIFRGNSSRGIF